MDQQTAYDTIMRLSARKRDCLRLAHLRLTHQEIADRLGLTAGTVKTYLADARSQLGGMSTRRAAQLLSEIEGHQLPTQGELTSGQLLDQPPTGAFEPSSTDAKEAPGHWLREEPPHFEIGFAAVPPDIERSSSQTVVFRALRIIGISMAISIGLVTTVIYAADVMMAISRRLAGN